MYSFAVFANTTCELHSRFQWTFTYHNKLNNVKKLPSVLSGNFFLFADGGHLHDAT